MNNRCPNCNAVLKLNSEKNKLQCEYCKFECEIENSNSNIYTCTNCRASIISNEKITECIYCKNKEFELTDEMNLKPNYILPFKIDKKHAINELKKINKYKFLKPKEFKSKNFNNVVGIYIPYLLCDYDSIGMVEANCDIVSKWRSDGYRYKKTDTYNVIRSGKMTLNNVPVLCSKYFKEDLYNKLYPFDYNELKKYDGVDNYLIENSTLNKEELINKSKTKIKELFKDEMKKDIQGYNTIEFTNDSINLNNIKTICVLIPIWLLNIKYNNEIYTFAINGQTGKLSGTIPKKNSKLISIFLISFILIFTILFILNYLKVVL